MSSSPAFQSRAIFHGRIFCSLELGCVVNSRSIPRVRPAAGLPREDLRLDLRSDRRASCCIFQLRNLVLPAAGARLSWRPRVGQKAPDFFLLDQNGKPVGLGDLLSNSNGAVLMFYRG